MKRIISIILFVSMTVFLIACKNTVPDNVGENLSTGETETSSPISLWLPPFLPEALTENIKLPEGVFNTVNFAEADVTLDVGDSDPISRWIYVLAAPFPTTIEGISLKAIMDIWKGEEPREFENRLLISGDTLALFEKLWGTPSKESVQITTSERITEQAWNQKNTWALLPFENLEPKWKVIPINEQSPISASFDSTKYPLSISFSLVGSEIAINTIREAVLQGNENDFIPSSNRFSDHLTTVMLTGVTALARGTAYLMEKYGMTYPAIDIGETLRAADILHISNEVPFTENCPDPFSNPANDAAFIFCSKEEYIQLLESIGTDVVELTGDHFRDWNADVMLNTIEMIEERGWQYYGGGRNYDDGVSPALFEHNGNKIAFLGCNAKQPGYATADDEQPGAVHCDMERMTAEVRAVQQAGYIPIFTFQHIEHFEYDVSEEVAQEFHQAADVGALIVSGSQAQIPQAIEFYKKAFIHYGLGNLFFDQFNESFGQRQAVIDEHIIYNGKHISTKLIPILFIDLARPRKMNPEESIVLLETIYEASGW